MTGNGAWLLLTVVSCLVSLTLQTNGGSNPLSSWSEMLFYSMCSEEIPFMIRSVPRSCNRYIVCSGGQMIPGRCPEGHVFNDFNQMCQIPTGRERLRCSRQLLANMPYNCMWQPYGRVASYLSCAQYFDCQTGRNLRGAPPSYVTECPYPKLFSTVTRRCEPFYKVRCPGRAVPKAPCDYLQYQQLYDGTTERCDHHHPSCVRRRDGQYRVRNSTRSYYVCRAERTVNIHQCQLGLVFSDIFQRCHVPVLSALNLQRPRPTVMGAQRPRPTIISAQRPLASVIGPHRPLPTVISPPLTTMLSSQSQTQSASDQDSESNNNNNASLSSVDKKLRSILTNKIP